MNKYVPAAAEVVELRPTDVITSSIGRDEGTNDGEWTPYGSEPSSDREIWG